MLFDRPIYPFSAIIGQNALKLALILNAIDPSIGGVLLKGPKGSGKSLTVRALSEILPEVKVVQDCIFNCSPYDPTNMCEECRIRFKNGFLPKATRKMPIIQIPIGATEDRIIGSVDVEKALQKGIRTLQPGLLAEANQGILYIDEVNLLPDHLVDTILDAAASGWNVVEREGISISHPSRFILIGSMNPEEGELRPQILDRFGLHAKSENINTVTERIKVIQLNEEFLQDPVSLRAKYSEQQKTLINNIEAARTLLPHVTVSSSILASVAKICTDLKVDGYRPDIVIVKASKAHSALNGRNEVNLNDVIIASQLTLTHRTRASGLMPPASSKEVQDAFESTPIAKVGRTRKDHLKMLVSRKSWNKIIFQMRLKYLSKVAQIFLLLMLLVFFTSVFSMQLLSPSYEINLLQFLLFSSITALAVTLFLLTRPQKKITTRLLDFSKITSEQTSGPQTILEDSSDEPVNAQRDIDYHGKSSLESGPKTIGSIAEPPKDSQLPPPLPRTSQDERSRRGRYYLIGKRAKIVTSSSRGRYVWPELPKERPFDIAFGPTIRAAAPYQQTRKLPTLAISIEPEDLRIKMREYRAPFSIILLVDMSLSMATSITNLGRAILSLHRSVYRRRDRVGLIVFKASEAVIVQHPTTNLNLVVQKLWKVGTSDLTPMATGMFKAWKILKLEKQRNRDCIPMLILVSDGIVNVPLPRRLSSHVRHKLLSEAQGDVMDVTRLLVRDGVRTIIINTAHRKDELLVRTEGGKIPFYTRWYLPTEFLMELARVANGSYYGLSLNKEEELIKGTKLEKWFYLE